MRHEVHLHADIPILEGVSRRQIEQAFAPLTEYLDADGLADVKSLEQDEPGFKYDDKDLILFVCWTGEVGRSFLARVTEAFQALGPLTEYASEVTVTCYHDNGKEEFQQIFIGPSAEAIHEIRRQCVEEDLAALLSPHFDKARVDKVTNMVNQMFDEEWKSRPAAEEQPVATAALQPHPRNRHLH